MSGRSLSTAVGAAALIFACGSDGDQSGDGSAVAPNEPSTAQQIDALCESQCARSARCATSDADTGAGSDAGGCGASCDAKLGPLSGKVRADIIVTMTDCFETLSCDESDDNCLARALDSIGFDAESSPVLMQCSAKEQECRGTEGDFSDDLCATFVLLVDEERARASSCFEQPCSELPGCLGPFVGG